MPSIVPTALIDVRFDSLFRRIFRCYGRMNSLFGRPRELVRNAVKLLRKPTSGTAKWRPNPQISLITSLFAGKCARPAFRLPWPPASSIQALGEARRTRRPLGKRAKVVAVGHLLLPACGEKVGMRGLSASRNRAERAPHPDPLPAKSGAREKRPAGTSGATTFAPIRPSLAMCLAPVLH
jgi:hypothetical protein